jgi:hypothetical protein
LVIRGTETPSEEAFRQVPVPGEVIHEEAVDDVTGLDDAGIGEAVVDAGAFAAGLDDAAVAEDGEVTGDDGLGGSEPGDEVADGAFALTELVDNHEAARVSEGLAEFGLEAEELEIVIGGHDALLDIDIYAYPYIY